MNQAFQVASLLLFAGLVATARCASGEDPVLFRDSALSWIGAKNGPEVAFRESRKLLDSGFMDPQAEALLRASEVFTREVFNVPTLQSRRAVTYRDQTGDMLVSEWSVSEPFGAGIITLTDTPYLSVYHLALNGCKIASRADLTSFLTTLLSWGKPPFHLWPGALIVDLQPNAPNPGRARVGLRFLSISWRTVVGTPTRGTFLREGRGRQSTPTQPTLSPDRFRRILANRSRVCHRTPKGSWILP